MQEMKYGATHSYLRHYMEVRGQIQALAALPKGKNLEPIKQ